jgi:hypothetical protein
MRIRRLQVAVLAVFVTVAALTASTTSAAPNVVVILADDLGFSDLGCQGGEIDTPALDRLAAGGLRYTQASNTARCWPTRGALLTGYYPQAIRRDALPGTEGGVKSARPPWARLLPALLGPAGYRSYHSGKWHLDGDPRGQGFHRSLEITAAGQSNYFDAAGAQGMPAPATADGFYATTAIGDQMSARRRSDSEPAVGQQLGGRTVERPIRHRLSGLQRRLSLPSQTLTSRHTCMASACPPSSSGALAGSSSVSGLLNWLLELVLLLVVVNGWALREGLLRVDLAVEGVLPVRSVKEGRQSFT